MYCIVVKTELYPGKRDEFLPVMLENAKASVEKEAGCFVFDVLQDKEDMNTFYLYEIYASQEALEEHKTMEHYKKSRAIVNELIAKQTVIRADVLAANPIRQ